MQASVNPAQSNPVLANVNKVAHGLTLPVGFPLMAIYVDSGTGNIVAADASLATTVKAAFVIEIVDVDNLKMQTTGWFKSDAHGLTPGNYYYVTDAGDGGFSTTPGTINDIAFFVFDSDHLILLDNRPL